MYSFQTSNPFCNEIELCEIADIECIQRIDKALTHAYISFCFQWHKTSPLTPWSRFLSTGPEVCSVCINEKDKETAEALVRGICDETGCKVKFTYKKLKKRHVNYE
ncbi:MAG: hypothetical protein IJB84_01315 [Lachnospiraceae bacterium]|nr:hypothetical protein [Lachnospiraceae bacterium]